jgi:hypothetical protein
LEASNLQLCPDVHFTENPIYVFPEMKLHGLIPNSCIRGSVSDLYIPRICQLNRQTDPGYINRSEEHECRNWETKHYNPVWNKAVQFHFWEFRKRNQTFILDSYPPFICSDIQWNLGFFHEGLYFFA